jgi:hypothetical protein
MNIFSLHTLTWNLPGAPTSIFCPRELEALIKAGLIFTYPKMVRIEVRNIVEPLFDSRAGLAFDAPSLSYRLKQRVAARPRCITFASATRKASRMMGGPFGGEPLRPVDADHHFLLAHVYRSLGPKGWESEPGPINGESPDAAIRRRGKTTLIEAGGSSYTTWKLQSRHDAWSDYRYLLF